MFVVGSRVAYSPKALETLNNPDLTPDLRGTVLEVREYPTFVSCRRMLRVKWDTDTHMYPPFRELNGLTWFGEDLMMEIEHD